jgi:hypothetical protein
MSRPEVKKTPLSSWAPKNSRVWKGFGGFRSVHRNPTRAWEIKFRPAVIAGDVSLGPRFRKGETDFKTRRDVGAAHHSDKKRVKVSTIATLGGASPQGIATAPAFTGFVIVHGENHVVVNALCFGELRAFHRRMLFGELKDNSIQRHELVGLQIALECGIVGGITRGVFDLRRREGTLCSSRVATKPTVASNPEASCSGVGWNKAYGFPYSGSCLSVWPTLLSRCRSLICW